MIVYCEAMGSAILAPVNRVQVIFAAIPKGDSPDDIPDLFGDSQASDPIGS